MRASAKLLLVLALGLAACASRPEGNLLAVQARAPGASNVDMLVATTRSPIDEPRGVMFGGDRSIGLNYADIAVSIPPDAVRKIGEIQWPASQPGDPARDFVTLHAQRLALKEARTAFDRRVAANAHHHVLIFVHGYNTRFEEAVYRFAQITHDSGANVVPLLFTWPSRGRALAYFYDRESANYSRDALEAVLQFLARDPKVSEVSILAHSLGNYVAVEALRQMAIRDHGLPAKIKNIMLASPDIDIDVFRREIAEIDQSRKPPSITLFVSQDDKALGLSKLIAGDEPRIGAVDPTRDPYKSILERAKVRVVDLTAFNADDPANHSEFASEDVVRSIGVRLAGGQIMSDGRQTLGETLGSIAINGTKAVGEAAADIATGSPQEVSAESANPAKGDAEPLVK
jgi:esterase/lipase superfamily enzyme